MVDHSRIPDDRPDAEIDYLLSLLGDYSEKIRVRMDAAERARMTRWSWALASSALATVVAAVGYTIVKEIDAFLSYGLVAGVALIPLLLMWGLRSQDSVSRQRREVQRLADVLDILIRRASQLEDHGQANVAQRVILDIRLSEAEAALSDVRTAIRLDQSQRVSAYGTLKGHRKHVATGTLE